MLFLKKKTHYPGWEKYKFLSSVHSLELKSDNRGSYIDKEIFGLS